MAGVTSGFALDCQTASSVPAGQVKVGGGRVILDNDGVLSLNGGPAVYTRIKNRSAADLSYWVAVEVFNQDTKHYVTNCLYRSKLPPYESTVVWGSSSAEKLPIPWRVSVTIGPESDGDERIEGLTYEIYSIPSKKNAQ